MDTISPFLLVLLVAFCVGMFLLYRSIHSIREKQGELVKDVAEVKYRLNDVKVTVDRINGVTWALKDDIENLKFYSDYEDLLDEDDD